MSAPAPRPPLGHTITAADWQRGLVAARRRRAERRAELRQFIATAKSNLVQTRS